MSILTPEQARHQRIMREYTELVTAKKNLIGLCGYQPTLTKIRKAYQADKISDSDLQLVLNNVAITLGGEAEPFENKEQAWAYMFKDSKPEPKKPTPSIEEQRILVRAINAKYDEPKKKYSGPRRKPKKKVEPINVAALPASLRHLAK